MFDNLKTLIIEGKTVAKLSINGKTIWESLSYQETSNEYGTTVTVNRYTEETNEYGTTAII